jgi:hypothetical protein
MARAILGDNESLRNPELPMRLNTNRRLACLMLLAVLGNGCTDPNSFAPSCPVSAILPDTGDITRWRPGAPATTRDLTDLVLSGRLTAVKAECFAGTKPDSIRAKVQVQLALNRGPAAPGRTADVAYFVAVTRGDAILDKAVYPLHVTFPPNTDSITLVGSEVNMVIPTPKGVSGPDYTVAFGFQLTPEELAANRAQDK